ncbi:MAG: acyl-CoA dehydrogenase family protein [Acidimicrobiia bacterium]|nr:acyl-CoA dehydrogenase family protein [Acidimicrobiia bacterium]
MSDDAVRTDSADEAEFRQKVRSWMDEHLPRKRTSNLDDGPLSIHPIPMTPRPRPSVAEELAATKAYQSALYDAGLAGLNWPTEYGGQGLPNRDVEIFNEESAAFEVPATVLTIGLGMCGPTVLEWGTEEVKERYVRPMLRADEIWCQLFSEPGAGSDVASLQMRAERDGDEYVLNGQKVWTSGAHYCDFGVVIARTDPAKPKHRGITMFIVDMRAPGVTIRPLIQITGGSNFNEVFFDDVRVHDSHRLGPENEGWRAAVAMLANERVAIGSGGGGRGNALRPYLDAARARGLDKDPVIRQRLADLYIRQQVLGFIGQRTRAATKAGQAPGPEGSIGKLYGALLSRRASDLGADIAGAGAQAWDDERTDSRWAMAVVGAPGGAIAGGTNEVQRNIIGERVLGLPKEPQVDRDMPFRDLVVGTQRG